MAAKDVQSPEVDESYFAKDLFLASKWVRRSTLNNLSGWTYRMLDHAGWLRFAEWEGPWMLEAYAEFWCEAKMVDESIVGIINDKQYLINAEAIAAVDKGKAEGLIYQPNWNEFLDDKEIDTVLYGKPRTGDIGKFLRGGNLVPECRVLHNLLFNIFTPRLGSRDNVSHRDRFCLYHLMKMNKVSLPHVIMDHWVTALKGRNLKRKSSVPYPAVFAKIILNQGFEHKGCLWYAAGAEIKQATFAKMHLYRKSMTRNEADERILHPERFQQQPQSSAQQQQEPEPSPEPSPPKHKPKHKTLIKRARNTAPAQTQAQTQSQTPAQTQPQTVPQPSIQITEVPFEGTFEQPLVKRKRTSLKIKMPRPAPVEESTEKASEDAESARRRADELKKKEEEEGKEVEIAIKKATMKGKRKAIHESMDDSHEAAQLKAAKKISILYEQERERLFQESCRGIGSSEVAPAPATSEGVTSVETAQIQKDNALLAEQLSTMLNEGGSVEISFTSSPPRDEHVLNVEPISAQIISAAEPVQTIVIASEESTRPQTKEVPSEVVEICSCSSSDEEYSVMNRFVGSDIRTAHAEVLNPEDLPPKRKMDYSFLNELVMRRYAVASCEERLVKPDWVFPDAEDEVSDASDIESESANDGYFADDEDSYEEESPFFETFNPYIYKGKKGFHRERMDNPFFFHCPLKPVDYDKTKRYAPAEQRLWLQRLPWDALATLNLKGLEGIDDYKNHLNGLLIEGPALGYEPNILPSASRMMRPYHDPEDKSTAFHHCRFGDFMSGVNVPSLFEHWHLDAVDCHDPQSFTIPLNKTEYLGVGYSLGTVLPWTRPHCSGIHPSYFIKLLEFESPEDFDHALPVDYDIPFWNLTQAYRRETQIRTDYLRLLRRLAEREGRNLPFMMGSQFSALASKETKFFVMMDRKRPCLIKYLAKGKEKKEKEVPKVFKWARHISKRLPASVYARLKTLQEQSSKPVNPQVLRMIDEHEATMAHCSGVSFDEEDSATVGRIFPGSTTAYISYPDQPDLQLVPVKRTYVWRWSQPFSAEVHLPLFSLRLRGTPVEPIVEEVDSDADEPLSSAPPVAEYNALKRKYDALEGSHEDLKKQNAELKDKHEDLNSRVEQLQAMVMRLMQQGQQPPP